VFGSLYAPVTCDDAALRDATSICNGGTRSDDRWTPGVYGVEAAIGGGNHRVKPHAGIGYTILRPRFQVYFTNAAGSVDRRKVEVNLERVALFAGASVRLGALDFTGEAYGTVSDAIAGRLVVRAPLLH
jgi:hypothetical protein